MKKADFIINIALVPIDFALIWLAGLTAYYIRFSDIVAQWRPVFYEMPLYEYYGLIFKVAILAIVIFAFLGFYIIRSKKIVKEFPKIIAGVSLVVVFLILSIFLQRELFSSRFIIVFGWGLAIIYLTVIRMIFFGIRNFLFKKNWGLSNIIILGSDEDRKIITKTYQKNPKLGYKIIAKYKNLSELEQSQTARKLLDNKKIHSIIQTDSSLDKKAALDLLTFCQENHIGLQYVANLFQAQSLNMNVTSLAGLPIVEIKGTTLDGWHKVYKRIFDFIMAFILLILLSPFFVVISIIIKSTSKGSVFVSLDRIGHKNKKFKILKFRSMVKDAHKLKEEMLAYNERSDGPLFKMKNDPRVTRVGKWLRQTSLDELPQLFNVLVGQMSLVGPRPHEPEEVSKYQRGYKKLLTIKPGITGMAQVSGRSDLPFAEEAKLDIFYIENWSMLLDFIIFLKTIKVIFKQDAAY